MTQATLSQRPYVNSGLFSGHYLDDEVPEHSLWDCDESAAATRDSLADLYEKEQQLVNTYNEDELRGAWIDEVLDALGYDQLNETSIPRGKGQVDYLLFESAGKRREARQLSEEGDLEETYRHALGFVEAKQWNEDFDQEFSNRSYRNASAQVRHYLDRTPSNIRWGILTNGRKWRLYGNREYETQIFYEVDLIELLTQGDTEEALEEFKYFYVFFGANALQGATGSSFLDEVWSESETYAEQLGEDLQDNVFTALRVLGEGFVECNDLDIRSDHEETLRELKEHSLVYLYRLMFVLYAEGKELIHPETPSARTQYEENFSLERIREEIVDEAGAGEYFSNFSTRRRNYWQQLNDVFELIDEGYDELGIPAYNGGLFNGDEHEFLAENHVTDYYLAQVIYYLSTTTTEEGDLVYADYADLDTRHLGSVYEGLLEHQFRIADEKMAAVSESRGQVWRSATAVDLNADEVVDTVDKGGLYIVNDDGERRSTGSYYTPDYVVTYIVEQTVNPLLADIRDSLRDDGLEPGTHEYAGKYYDRVLGLNILDPAMGSGHFLTAVTSYLAEQVQDVAREAEISTLLKEEDIRRDIAKECIFGVDLNEMAVELAKLSMWLETLASDKPLTFLDHHFKHGNSLLGADLDELDALPGHQTEDLTDDGQSKLSSFNDTILDTIDDYLKDYAKFQEIDDDTIDEIEQKKAAFEDLEGEEMHNRLEAIANVHTATHFDVNVPVNAYDNLKKALQDDHETSWREFTEKEWFQEAQQVANAFDFFHWKLEFVEAFYNSGRINADQGFDAVVGNPPYFNLEIIEEDNVNACLEARFPDIYAGKADIHYFFCRLGIDLIRNGGGLGFIVSRYFTEAHFAKDFREAVSDQVNINEIVDFGNNQVFPGVDTLTVILELTKGRTVDETTITYLLDELDSEAAQIQQTLEQITVGDDTDAGGQYTIDESSLGGDRWLILPKSLLDIKQTIEASGTRLGEDEMYRTGQGMMTGLNEAFTVSPEEIQEWGIEDEVLKPLVKNGDLRKYQYNPRDLDLIYLENKDISDYPNTEAYLSQYRSDLEDRAKDNVKWFRYLNPINQELFDKYDEKIICPFVATENRFYLDRDGLYNDGGDVEVVVPNSGRAPKTGYLVALLNSTLLEFYHLHHAKLKRDGFYEYFGNSLQDIPVFLDFGAADPNLSVLPDEIVDETEGSGVEEVLHHANDVLTKLLAEKRALEDSLDPFKYLHRSADVGKLTDVLSDEFKYGRRANDIVFDSRHDITTLELVQEDSDDWVLRARLKLREKVGDDFQWKRDEEETGIVRQWIDLYRFPAAQVDTTRLRKYQLVFDNYDAFENKSPKNGYPGGKTRTVQEKLERADLPVVDDVNLNAYFELEQEIVGLQDDIMEIYDGIDQVVYELYGVNNEEIARIEEVNGKGLQF